MKRDKMIINFDYLSITFDIPVEERDRTLNRLRTLSRQDKSRNNLKVECAPKKHKDNKSRYLKNYHLFIRPTSKNVVGSIADYHGVEFKLSFDPIDKNQVPTTKRKKQHYAKLTFNPNQVRFTGAQKIRSFLRDLISKETVDNIYETGRITRADVCVDLHKPTSVFFPYAPKMRHYEPYKTEDGGRVTGVSLGSGKSKSRIIVYDKNEEQKYNGKIPPHEIHFRLELRQRDIRCSPKLFSASPLKEKLRKVEFFSDTLFENKSLSQKFRSNLVEKGISGSLKCFEEKSKRRSILKTLRTKHLIEKPFDVDAINIKQFSILLSAFKKA